MWPIPSNAKWLGDSNPYRNNKIGMLRGTNNLSLETLYGSREDPHLVECRSGMSGIECWKVPVVIESDGTVTLGPFTYRVEWNRE